MAITNGYATVVELRDKLNIKTDTDIEQFERIIEAASRWIDRRTHTRFYAASETRTYRPKFTDWLITDDLLSVTTLKTDEDGDGTFEITWTSSDYALEPFNAALDGRPYRGIYTTPGGSYTFPVPQGRPPWPSVEIVGSFGYASTTPDAIKEACLLTSARIYQRRNLIFGTTGNADLGTIEAIIPLSKDGEIMALIGSVSKRLI